MEVDKSASLEETNTWDQEVDQQELREVMEDFAVQDEQNNHPNGILPQAHGEVLLCPNAPSPGELQQQVGDGALAWVVERFGNQGPMTLATLFGLLRVGEQELVGEDVE